MVCPVRKTPPSKSPAWVRPSASAAEVSRTRPLSVSTVVPSASVAAARNGTKSLAPGARTRTVPETGWRVVVSPNTGGGSSRPVTFTGVALDRPDPSPSSPSSPEPQHWTPPAASTAQVWLRPALIPIAPATPFATGVALLALVGVPSSPSPP
jgi:hypothetical protein